MRTLAICLSLALVMPAMAAKKPIRPKPPNIVIPKPIPVPPGLDTIAVIAIPPLAVFYDLNRRWNCLNPPDPLGMGGPGFDGKPMPVSGVMTPCYLRGAAPK